ncbi:hypothetical protein OAC06_02905, partial [Alphaproteobacteria bacterium]|nr:hypothetical protein [Alphaproteobacteria bacterium]
FVNLILSIPAINFTLGHAISYKDSSLITSSYNDATLVAGPLQADKIKNIINTKGSFVINL